MTTMTTRKPPPPAASTAALIEVFLQPGEFAVGDARHRIRTLLGSCVSVTLWCPLLRVGAMSHTLLASRGGAGSHAGATSASVSAATATATATTATDARYGDEALALMLAALAARGISGPQCEAKIFGGGDMFASHKIAGAPAIGRRNGEAARELLAAHGIAVRSESLFGDGHRHILFDVASGDVWSRQLPPGNAGAAASALCGAVPGPAVAASRSGA